jgi:hypothetical protein
MKFEGGGLSSFYVRQIEASQIALNARHLKAMTGFKLAQKLSRRPRPSFACIFQALA